VIVTGYNQEKFIRDAIKSAFSQDHEGLEIILSDDCSTDGTYEIMQTQIRDYHGTHTIVLNKNPCNLGIVHHVNYLFELARSDLLIFFHGDDVSVPTRAKQVVHVFKEQQALLVHSYANVMGGARKAEDEPYRSASFFSTTEPIDVATSGALYLGATSAFHKDIMRKFGPMQKKNTFEDLILGFRASLEERVSLIREPLVLYRPDVGISARKKPRTIADAIHKRRETLAFRIETLEQRYQDACKTERKDKAAICGKISDAMHELRLRSSFFDPKVSERVLWAKYPLQTLDCAVSEANRLLRKRV
jgi:glycosyltransferase involved in cell wall biosynthesis